MFASQSELYLRNGNPFPFVILGFAPSPTSAGIKPPCAVGGVFFLTDVLATNRLLFPTQPTPTFEEFIETRYMPFVEKRKRSFATDRRLLKRYVYPALALRRLSEITSEEIEKWKEDFRSRGYAPSSVNRVLSVIKYALQCAVNWSILDRNPARAVAGFPLTAPRERHLSINEARRLVGVLKESSHRNEAKAIELLLLTGARKSEILTARWENVNFDEKILTVPLSKSGKTRYIPLSKQALEVFRALRNERKAQSTWVFPQKRQNKPIQNIWRTWSQARKEAGLTDVRLHDLRHSFASFLINSGRTLYEVQRILGHGTPSVTMRYAHLDNQSLLLAVNNIGRTIIHSRHLD